MSTTRVVFALFALLAFFRSPIQAQTSDWDISLSFSEKALKKPFTGRVYLFFSKSDRSLPRGQNWFKPEPVVAIDVEKWQADTPLSFPNKHLGHPYKLSEIPNGDYFVWGIMDLNLGDDRSFSTASGNPYSQPKKVSIDGKTPIKVALTIDQVYVSPAFKETNRVKHVKIPSKILSKFHDRNVHMEAAVILPKDFNQARRKYPVIYSIPGFGGSHFSALALANRNPNDVAGEEMLYVVLNPNCRWGHHVFADSVNNGPWGEALTKELIPHIEKTYRGIGEPYGRFVTGHSSGGWSSLWLQVAYPTFFGGVWSTAPDPVDFRDFQRVNIYQDDNIFKDKNGKDRPLARKNGKVLLNYKQFSDMEHVMGHGGQLQSFEAVFGGKDKSGTPAQLWNRVTGKIDHEVAESWERYDIRKKLEREWPSIGGALKGKLHVYMGSEDNFYLEGATKLLKSSLESLGSDAKVEIFPGRDHGTLMDRKLRERIAQEMAQTYRNSRVTEKRKTAQ